MRNVDLFLFKSKWLNFLILPCIFLASTLSYGQVSSLLNPTYGYTFSNSSGTYTAITGATVFQSGSAITTDGVSSAITLPFTFTFNGIKENTIYISNNGFITFGIAPLASTYTPLSITTSGASGYDGAIAGTAMNCVASTASGATPEISYGSSGGDFVVQFQDIGQSGFAAIRMTYQIVLKSDGKTIQIVYGPNNVGVASSGQCQVGLRGTNDEDWNNRTLASGGNWNTAGGAAGSLNTNGMSLTSSTTLPTSGRIFQWSPTSYLPTYNSNPTTYQEFTSWVNGSGPSNVPSTNWATNGYGNASWQIDNTTASTTGSGWGGTGGAYSPADYANASGGRSARFHSQLANSPQVGYLDYYVDMSSLTGTPTLDFYHINTNGTDILQIFLSTNGGTTFTQIGTNIGTSASWTAKSISLGSTNSATSIIRFKATADFGSTDIGIDHVVVTPPPTPPTITSYAPITDFCINGGQTITITGTNFTGTTSVTFNGVNATSFTVVSSTSITAVTPASLTAGVITITNPAGSASSSTYNVALNPTVTVSPTSASLCTGGTPITLTAAGANTYAWTPSTGLSATTGDVVTANPTSTITYTVTGTDGNSCTNTATAVITVSTTPVAPTTTGYGICLSGTIPGGQGLTSTSVGGGVITGSQTINFDVASQPTETNSAPGNIVASATMNAMPAGSTITSVVITYSGLTALSSSWRSDIKLGLSGALINSAASDPLAPGTAGILNYSRTASSGITSTISGGTVNLLYWDAGSDNAGAEATFPTGTSVASVVVNYSYPSATAISWYDAATGGNFIGNGSPFNPIGLDPALPNSNVAGAYTYYAQVNNGACSSTRTAATLTIGSTPSATATSPQTTICIGNSVTLSANPMGASPFTYLWNDPTAATSQTVSVSPTSNTTYTVTVTDACSTTTTASVSIIIDAPSVGSPAATSVCGSGTSTLSTTGSTGTIKWYDAATNGNLVGTGTPIVSPTITSATTYYVEASNLSTPLTGLGSLGTPTPSNSLLSVERGIVITVTSSGTLNTAQFYSALGTYVGTARLVNNTSGTQLASTPISGTASSAGLQTMNLNWNLTAGTTYRLLLTLTTGTYSNNNTSVNYSSAPWNNFGSAGTISSGYDSGVSSTTYSNFYNMQFTPVCATSRTAVVVPYMVPPTSGTATATPAAICAGSASSLNLSGFDPSYSSFTWSGGAGTGATVSVMPLATTTYTVTATDGTCSTSTSVTVTVNSLPATPTAGSNSPICAGSTLNLTAANVFIPYSVTNNSGVSFVDISSSGTSVSGTLADDSEHNITIPTFTFNNISYTAARVGVNGLIVLGSTSGDIVFGNVTLPSTANTAGNIFISPYWDDLDINLLGTIKTETVGSKFIIQYTNIDHNSYTTGGITFQVQLDLTTSAIHLVYQDVIFGSATYDSGAAATIGIQYSSTQASQFSHNTASLSNGQSITFIPSAPYSWSGPNGFTSSLQNPSITGITTAGAGIYTVTITDPISMCFSTSSVSIEIGGTNVTSTADAGPGTLRAALACVVDGGTIMYDQPTTATTILTAPLTIDKNVTIMGLDAANRPEITTSSSGISIDALKTLTLKDVDVKSTAPTQTFTGAGSVSISGLTVGKQ